MPDFHLNYSGACGVVLVDSFFSQHAGPVLPWGEAVGRAAQLGPAIIVAVEGLAIEVEFLLPKHRALPVPTLDSLARIFAWENQPRGEVKDNSIFVGCVCPFLRRVPRS